MPAYKHNGRHSQKDEQTSSYFTEPYSPKKSKSHGISSASKTTLDRLLSKDANNTKMDTDIAVRFNEKPFDLHARLRGGGSVKKLGADMKQLRKASAGQCHNVITLKDAKAKSKQQRQGIVVGNVHLRLSDSHENLQNFGCHEIPLDPPKQPKSKTRGTQSLYRESSAQTLPYLPAVANDPEELEDMELFKLPTILPGDGPPGLYEVEILERARKRWAFARALKENFHKQLQEDSAKAKLPEHRHILQAFEWEHWMQREEYIQECQMRRLDLLIEMFEQREQEMLATSDNRINISYAAIEAEKQKKLKRNEIEYGRSLRRLEMQHKKQSRSWHKENITQGLSDPCSEYYAPKMRYGVNPSHRHYIESRKGFDARMSALEQTVVDMDPKYLKCPFAKLKSLSKPKEVKKEVEQNFCSDENLKKLYDGMRSLRESSRHKKTAPICLKAKQSEESKAQKQSEDRSIPTSIRVSFEDAEQSEFKIIQDSESKILEDRKSQEEHEQAEYQLYLAELKQEKLAERTRLTFLCRESHHEEVEALIHHFEGNAIGRLFRFLTEEMVRLQEQRKLHLINMVSKQQRWSREAAEAGLRQKENRLRQAFEEVYAQSSHVYQESAKEFQSTIIQSDANDYAEQLAEKQIQQVAKYIDKEVQGWLESIQAVQNPLNYQDLQTALKNIIMPDVETILCRYERDECIKYIINDVLFPLIFHLLLPYDICWSITNNTIDHLIDNDLYANSTEASSVCDCLDYDECTEARHEALIILRKLIRHSVAGRRWRTATERIADENVFDVLEQVFEETMPKECYVEKDMSALKPMSQFFSHYNKDYAEPSSSSQYFSEISVDGAHRDSQIMKLEEFTKASRQIFTKSLDKEEHMLILDPDRLSSDKELIQTTDLTLNKEQSIVRNIPSTHDITSVPDFEKAPVYALSEKESSEEEEVIEDQYHKEEEEMPRSEDERNLLFMAEEDELEITEEETEESVIIADNDSTKQSPAEANKMDSSVHFNESDVAAVMSPTETSSGSDLATDDGNNLVAVAISYDPSVNYSIAMRINKITKKARSEESESEKKSPEKTQILQKSENSEESVQSEILQSIEHPVHE